MHRWDCAVQHTLIGAQRSVPALSTMQSWCFPLYRHGPPTLERLGFGWRDGLDDTKKLLSNIGKSHLAIGGTHFQLVTNCYRLANFLHNTAFENLPILTGCLVVAICQYLHHINDREIPYSPVRRPMRCALDSLQIHISDKIQTASYSHDSGFP